MDDDPPLQPDPPDEPEPVRRDSLIANVLLQRPDARRVLFEEFQLPCYRCEARYSETVAEGVGYTGLDPDAVVARLNACPPKPPQGAEAAE